MILRRLHLLFALTALLCVTLGYTVYRLKAPTGERVLTAPVPQLGSSRPDGRGSPSGALDQHRTALADDPAGKHQVIDAATSIEFRRLGKVESNGRSETLDSEWQDYTGQELSGLCIARRAGGPVILLDAENLDKLDLPAVAEVNLTFSPDLPPEIAACVEVSAEPVGEIAQLWNGRVSGCALGLERQPVHEPFSNLQGLHEGIRYRLVFDSGCESSTGCEIEAGGIEFTPPAEVLVRWYRADGIEFILDPAPNRPVELFGYLRRTGEGSRVLATTDTGRAWIEAAYLKDGTYEVAAVGGAWRNQLPPATFSVKDGQVSSPSVRVSLEEAVSASISFSRRDGLDVAVNIFYFDSDGKRVSIPRARQEGHPCQLSWEGDTALLLGLVEPLDILCTFPDLASELYLTVIPGENLTAIPPTTPRRLFSEALEALRALHVRHPEAGRGFLDVLIGEEVAHPQWIRVKYVNLALENALAETEWDLPVRSGLRHRFVMFGAGGEENVVEFVAR